MFYRVLQAQNETNHWWCATMNNKKTKNYSGNSGNRILYHYTSSSRLMYITSDKTITVLVLLITQTNPVIYPGFRRRGWKNDNCLGVCKKIAARYLRDAARASLQRLATPEQRSAITCQDFWKMPRLNSVGRILVDVIYWYYSPDALIILIRDNSAVHSFKQLKQAHVPVEL